MALDLILTIVGGIIIFVGFVGCIIPVLPGSPLSWLGLLMAFFSSYSKCSIPALVIAGILCFGVAILDNIFPTLMTKSSGGSKAGTWGATIGMFVGMFIGPLGLIAGPFCGAYIGELVHDSHDSKRALKCAWGAFKGFILGTGLKMLASSICIWIFVIALIKNTH
ncbi:MAG: DUF456 domain-containing protein [Treponemataceae bacterium]|nr:DUF456 domain-containing protein [Treponemataceae bacterium]